MVCQRIMVEKGVVVCCGIVVVIGCVISQSSWVLVVLIWRIYGGC